MRGGPSFAERILSECSPTVRAEQLYTENVSFSKQVKKDRIQDIITLFKKKKKNCR